MPRLVFRPTRPLQAAGIRIEPTAVVGAGRGHDAGRHRRARPSRRAARRAGDVPRVAGRPPQLGLGDALGPELRGVGLAEDDQPRLEEAPGDEGVLLATSWASAREPLEVGKPAYSWARSLMRNGTPANGPVSDRSAARASATRVSGIHDRVDDRVHRVGALPGQGQQLGCRDLLGGHQAGQRGRVGAEVLVEVHPPNLGPPHVGPPRNARRAVNRWNVRSVWVRLGG